MTTRTIAWTTGSGSITLTYQGQGDGSIQVDSDANTLGTARSQVITVKTGQGGIVTKNLTVRQGACPFPVGGVRNYAYTGSYQEVDLPAGQYKLQCWGAQGGSNNAEPTYDITAQAGGKGGYSEGVITISQKTTVRVYVGGAGSSSAGGFNGGGSTTASCAYNSDNEYGTSRMGGGGGATDIRLSDGSLLSRMIVAGGGSGGAMCYKKVTTTTEESVLFNQITSDFYSSGSYYLWGYPSLNTTMEQGKKYKVVVPSQYVSSVYQIYINSRNSNNGWLWDKIVSNNESFEIPIKSGFHHVSCMVYFTSKVADVLTVDFYECQIITNETTDSLSHAGYAGGGVSGRGYDATHQGRQDSAGREGSFGQGANQINNNTRYSSGAGGGGWYGGGMNGKDITMDGVLMSGGGSGWVNVAASAGNRPSGYTGLELDSGITTAGDQSFEAPGGGTETGHEGNGYARITRLA